MSLLSIIDLSLFVGIYYVISLATINIRWICWKFIDCAEFFGVPCFKWDMICGIIKYPVTGLWWMLQPMPNHCAQFPWLLMNEYCGYLDIIPLSLQGLQQIANHLNMHNEVQNGVWQLTSVRLNYRGHGQQVSWELCEQYGHANIRHLSPGMERRI